MSSFSNVKFLLRKCYESVTSSASWRAKRPGVTGTRPHLYSRPAPYKSTREAGKAGSWQAGSCELEPARLIIERQAGSWGWPAGGQLRAGKSGQLGNASGNGAAAGELEHSSHQRLAKRAHTKNPMPRSHITPDPIRKLEIHGHRIFRQCAFLGASWKKFFQKLDFQSKFWYNYLVRKGEEILPKPKNFSAKYLTQAGNYGII